MHYTPMELPETPSFLNKEAVFGALLTSFFVLAVGTIFMAIAPGLIDQHIAANLTIIAQITLIGAVAMGTITGAANGKSQMMVKYFHAKQSLAAFTANNIREKHMVEPQLEPEVAQSQSRQFAHRVEQQRQEEKAEELSL